MSDKEKDSNDERYLEWVLGQFFSGDMDQAIESYSKMCDADEDDLASDYHCIWQPWEDDTCGCVCMMIDDMLRSLKAMFVFKTEVPSE